VSMENGVGGRMRGYAVEGRREEEGVSMGNG